MTLCRTVFLTVFLGSVFARAGRAKGPKSVVDSGPFLMERAKRFELSTSTLARLSEALTRWRFKQLRRQLTPVEAAVADRTVFGPYFQKTLFVDITAERALSSAAALSGVRR